MAGRSGVCARRRPLRSRRQSTTSSLSTSWGPRLCDRSTWSRCRTGARSTPAPAFRLSPRARSAKVRCFDGSWLRAARLRMLMLHTVREARQPRSSVRAFDESFTRRSLPTPQQRRPLQLPHRRSSTTTYQCLQPDSPGTSRRSGLCSTGTIWLPIGVARALASGHRHCRGIIWWMRRVSMSREKRYSGGV